MFHVVLMIQTRAIGVSNFNANELLDLVTDPSLQVMPQVLQVSYVFKVEDGLTHTDFIVSNVTVAEKDKSLHVCR
jgi:diketogulonate reductase-like aldo/keto reductase